MKCFKLLVAAVSVTIYTSCSQELEFPDKDVSDSTNEQLLHISDDEYVSLAMADVGHLSSDEVSDLLDSFLDVFLPADRSSHVVSTKLKQIKNRSWNGDGMRSRSSETADSVPFYCFEVSDERRKGYAVVSADGCWPGVIAYVPQGDMDSLEEYGNARMMMEASELFVLSEVKRIRTLVDSLKDETLEKVARRFPDEDITLDNVLRYVTWDKYMDGGRLSRVAVLRSPAYDNPPTEIIEKEGPFISTRWHQDAPYNVALPVSYHQSFGFNIKSHNPLGCGVVAAMQVLAYLKPAMVVDGQTMDWGKLTKNAEITGDLEPEVQRMVAALGKHVYDGTKTVANVLPDGEYGPYDDKTIPIVTSSSTKVADIISYLSGYVKCGTYYERFASDAMLNAIRGKHVSMMGGTSNRNTNHAWVIDGYAICRKSAREILRYYDFYLHANMGFHDGDYNGYYRVNPDITISFELPEYDNTVYSRNFWVISDIRPL